MRRFSKVRSKLTNRACVYIVLNLTSAEKAESWAANEFRVCVLSADGRWKCHDSNPGLTLETNGPRSQSPLPLNSPAMCIPSVTAAVAWKLMTAFA